MRVCSTICDFDPRYRACLILIGIDARSSARANRSFVRAKPTEQAPFGVSLVAAIPGQLRRLLQAESQAVSGERQQNRYGHGDYAYSVFAIDTDTRNGDAPLALYWACRKRYLMQLSN